MKKLTLTILHKLPNRVRLKTSKPIKNREKFCSIIKQQAEDTSIRYNRISGTILISFNPEEILLQEVIYRVAIAFSVENGLQPIKLLEEKKEKSLENLSLYSAGAIIVSAIHRVLNKNNPKIQDSLNIFSMGLTTAAIGEHIFHESRRQGHFDVEIIPALYLIKSFLASNSLSVVSIIWLTTFGRHLLSTNESAKNIKVFRFKDEKKNKYIYSLEATEDKSINTIADLFNQLLKKNKVAQGINDKYMIKTIN